MKHGFMPFMRAHGQRPGPGQRPAAAGGLAGGVAGLVTSPVLQLSGAADSVRLALALEGWWMPFLYVSAAALAGALYGAVFQRAAADRRGGWLFGISYGFLLWMLGPITLLQMLHGRPLATGGAAMGILAAHLASGLLLGLLFRPAHRVVRRSLEQGSRVGTKEVTHPAVERMYGR
jgi:hypothetical protein